ncbi:helix-turn-helix domain-containing protein [Lentzea sp. JNUCC 0626]|uniref:helix-turn-helix domain-containing protein n=1 Tax=Lentzea sp. JNUCC 0626 TaxID=3367513 RepID=UPI003749DF3C
MREALRAKHFGRFLYAYRHAHTPVITQQKMGDWLGLSQAQVSRLEGAEKPPSDLDKLEKWAGVLAVPADLLWFDLGDTSDESGVAPEKANLEDVDRRELLKFAGAALAAGSGLLDSPWQRVADLLTRQSPADAIAVKLIEEKTTDFFRSEETQPARELVVSLQTHRLQIMQLVKTTADDSLRRRLLSAAGETAALEGWSLFDVDRTTPAKNRYETAIDLARQAGDNALEACVLAYWSYLAADQKDPYGAVRLLADASAKVRGAAAATQSWVSARRAEELAGLGDASGTLRALDNAMTVFDYANPMTERSWTAFFTPSRLGGLSVSAFGRLGHPDTDDAARNLLDSLMPTENKVKALVLADLATSASRVADFDRVDALVGQAAPLAVRTEASLAIDRLWELVELLPEDRRSAAGRTREQLTQQLLA